MRVTVLLIALLLVAKPEEPIVRPVARGQTAPVPHKGDAADDPAIWIHPTSPELSLILGTDKQGGLHVYNMDGSQQQLVSPTCQPDNVDVVYGFPLDGKKTDLAVAGVRQAKAAGVKIWAIDAATRRLADITPGGVIKVFGGSTPYGSCAYRSPGTGKFYFFVNHKDGRIEQYLLEEESGKISARRVREMKLKSTPEGCVADEELGFFYVAEEKVGIWRFGAEPDAGDGRAMVAKVGEHGLKADVEGLTIYYAAEGRGYLIASSQGNSTFKVYERRPPNEFVLTIDPKGGAIDDVSDTDGIAVTNASLGDKFPKGMLIVQDGSNEKGRNQNFKMYGWEDVAEGRLVIDGGFDPR